MATLNGFKLTLPNGDVFSGKGNLSVTMITQGNYLIGGASGGGLLETAESYMGDYFEAGGQTGYADGYNQQIVAMPHGSHRIQIGFTKWEGETGESWGGIADSADALTKLQALDRALNTVKLSSTNIADLEVGEYHSNGDYNPIPVALGEVSLSLEAADQSSSFRGELILFEAVDLSDEIDTVSP